MEKRQNVGTKNAFTPKNYLPFTMWPHHPPQTFFWGGGGVWGGLISLIVSLKLDPAWYLFYIHLLVICEFWLQPNKILLLLFFFFANSSLLGDFWILKATWFFSFFFFFGVPKKPSNPNRFSTVIVPQKTIIKHIRPKFTLLPNSLLMGRSFCLGLMVERH